MILFFIGFVFGVFVAQESPQFPNIKVQSIEGFKFIKKLITENVEKKTSTKKEKSNNNDNEEDKKTL